MLFRSTASTGNGSARTYTWYRNGEEVTGVTDSTFSEVLTTEGLVTKYVYTVKLTQAYSGCASTNTVKDSVYVVPMPTVAISGDHDVCEGANNVSLVANLNDSIAGATYEYEWRINNTEVHTGKSYTLTSGGDSTYTYVVIVTDATRGCSATSEPYAVNVHKAPVVAFTDTIYYVCDGGVVTLTPTINDENIGGLVYQWYKNSVADGNAISGATEWSYTTSASETGDVDYYIVATQPSSDCKDTAKVTVKTPADPATVVSVDHNVICYGGQVVLTAHTTGGVDSIANPYIYTWYRNGVEIAGATDSLVVDQPTNIDRDTNSFSYYATVRQEVSGCQSVESNVVKVEVLPNPTLTITGDPILCGANPNANLAAHLLDSVGSYRYEWKKDGVATGVNSQTYTEALAQRDYAYEFQVIATSDSTGCSAVSDMFYVYVNDTATLVVTTDLDTICAGGEVTFTANVGGNFNDNVTYQWYEGTAATAANAVGGATGRTYTVTLDATGTKKYYAQASMNPSGCKAGGYDSVEVVSDPQIVTVSIEPSEDTLCEGREVTLTATASTGNGSARTYTWYRNGEEVTGVTDSTFSEVLTADGLVTKYVYTVKLTQAYSGCASTNTVKDSVYVVPMPTVAIEGDAIICHRGTISLTANLNDSIPGVNYTYTWRRNNTTIATGRELNDTVLTAQDEPYVYTVEVSDFVRGCSVLSAEYPVYVKDSISVELVADDTTICADGEM